MGQVEVEFELCKGCRLCIEACPRGVLSPGETINKKGFYPVKIKNPDKCTGCALCALMCPDIALRVFR